MEYLQRAWEGFKVLRRSGWFLAALLVFLVAAWYLVLFPAPSIERQPVMCEKCAFGEVCAVTEDSIARMRCRKCGGRVGFVWKCVECHFEFPLVLKKMRPYTMTRDVELQQRLNEWRCPNCRSSDCSQMTVGDFETVHPR